MAKVDFKAIGSRIKVARMKKRFTQQYVSDQCDISPQHISNIENGRTQLSLTLLVDIANCLDVSIDELLCDVINHSETVYAKEIQDIFEGCTPEEKRLIVQIVKSTKKSLESLKDNYQKP